MVVKGFPTVTKVTSVAVSEVPVALTGKWAGLLQDLLLRIQATDSGMAIVYSFDNEKDQKAFRTSGLKQLNKDVNGKGKWAANAVKVGGNHNVYFYYDKGK